MSRPAWGRACLPHHQVCAAGVGEGLPPPPGRIPFMILAGLDEAGYGPTLGPLVVSGTAFRVPDAGPDDPPPDLWQVLQGAASRKPDGQRIAVDDSKNLYSSAKGLEALEEGVLSFLGALDGPIPADFRGLLKRLSPAAGGDQYLDLYPWYRGQDLKLPAEAWANRIRIAAKRLLEHQEASGVRFLGVRAVPLEVLEFNQSIDRTGSKALVSFHIVTALLRWIWKSHPGERVEAMVDRQGGRMRYAPLLYQKVRPRGIRIILESEETSVYELTRDSGPPLRITFTVGCDGKWFPVALASMFCKYLRELHMSLFNRYWAGRRGDLKPTAGYAVDARRFLEDIAALRRELAIDDAVLIRKR